MNVIPLRCLPSSFSSALASPRGRGGARITTADFYAAGKGLTAAQNGFALAGDWCSAAAFLGFTGLTALYGMDGALYALGPLVAFCTVLLLIAEPLRNTGTYHDRRRHYVSDASAASARCSDRRNHCHQPCLPRSPNGRGGRHFDQVAFSEFAMMFQ